MTTNPKRIEIEARDLGDNRFLVVTVSYRKGGLSMYDYKTYPSGYVVTAKVETRKENIRTFDMFGGHSKYIQGAKRFSFPTLKKLASTVKDTEEYDAVTQDVLAKETVTAE